jgi:molybdopterin-containing oxidoreductase family membrane subunit
MSVETANGPARDTTSSQRRGVVPNIVIGVLVGLFGLSIASLVYALRSETMRPDFRLLTVSFLYLMGVSQAGVVFCAITRLVRAQWAKPYYRLAELSTLAFFPFALGTFLLIYVYARDELFHWLTNHSTEEHASPWLSSHWLLIRNLFGLCLFYGLSALYVVRSLKPDLLAAAQTSQSDARKVERQLYLLSPWVIVGFVICNTLFAWDFGMMLIPHWHSTVFPIYFWFGNLFAGAAALIVFPAVLGRSHAGQHFGPEQIRGLGMLLTTFTLMWLYFFWAQFFVIWFGNLPREFEPLWRQMYGHYAPYYWSMMTGCFFLPFAAFIFAIVKRSLPAMCLIGFGINAGIWINKYLMVMPALAPDDRPFDHWLDVILALGLLAGFVAAVVLLASRFPLCSQWEMRLRPEPRRQ